MKSVTIFVCFWLGSLGVMAQSISGQFTQLARQEVRLEGFNGFKSYVISSGTVDENGNFILKYNPSDKGVGYLIASEKKPFLVILSGEEIEISGQNLGSPESIVFHKGKENQWFEQFAKEHTQREQAHSAWQYLEKLYATDPLFSGQSIPVKAIEKEQLRLTQEETAFLEALPIASYVRWFLPLRKLVGSVSNIAQHRPEEIPKTIQFFRNMDYTDQKLYKSGILKDLIEGHFWLLENSGQSTESIAKEMKLSIDALFVKLVTNEKILNEVTDYLFELLEKHSLFEAAEYLAFKVHTEVSCKIDDDLARQLETYRAMKVGNTAPDIVFDSLYLKEGFKSSSSLSKINSTYKVVVFGASWCPNCQSDYPALTEKYTVLQNEFDLELIYISIDADRNQFKEYYKASPFIMYCDGKGWDTQSAKDYFVFGTPTYLLLDRNLKILAKLTSPEHLKVWMQTYGTKKTQ